MLETSIFSFFHYVFYTSNTKILFLSHIFFFVCKCLSKILLLDKELNEYVIEVFFSRNKKKSKANSEQSTLVVTHKAPRSDCMRFNFDLSCPNGSESLDEGFIFLLQEFKIVLPSLNLFFFHNPFGTH